MKMIRKVKFFILNIKSGVKYLWHIFCVKINMDTQIKSNKTAEEICKEIVEYIQSEDRYFIPSCEEFYYKYGYGKWDVTPEFLKVDVQNALSKIEIQETAMTKHYAMFADPEYTDNKGVTHKLNKRELSKRHTKVLKRK